MVSNLVTIIFTVTPSQLQHNNQYLPGSGHTHPQPLSMTSLSCYSLSCVQFS